jgi:hypothetical protein
MVFFIVTNEIAKVAHHSKSNTDSQAYKYFHYTYYLD